MGWRSIINNIILAANNSEAKQRKVAVEYVKLCGYEKGRPEKDAKMAHLSLDEIASQLGTSKRNLQHALSIERNLTEPMWQIVTKLWKIIPVLVIIYVKLTNIWGN